MEEMRITARVAGEGFELESYDAEMLFDRATALLNQGSCPEGVALYSRLADEFPTSRYVSPSLYNAGLCTLDRGERLESATWFERLLRDTPESPDVKHASLQLARIYVDLERWEDAVATADRVLTRDDLTPDERLEGIARAAQGHLGAQRLEEAARQAQSGLAYYRTRTDDERIADEFFAAAANFVLAETIRLRAEQVVIPEGDVQTQHAALESRARLILDAQREYFSAIELTNAHWAAAAGYRIGSMYDAFWTAIANAPVPPPRRPMSPSNLAIYEEEYHRALARLIEPLVRHSIRYWELTLMMVERTGVRTEWSERTRQDLERVRSRLLGQASGAERQAPAENPDTLGVPSASSAPRAL